MGGAPPFGPRWFQFMFNGIVAAIVALLFLDPSHLSYPGFVGFGIIGAILIGASLRVGRRTGFRWRGWQLEEARRNAEAQQRLEQVGVRIVAALERKGIRLPLRTRPR